MEVKLGKPALADVGVKVIGTGRGADLEIETELMGIEVEVELLPRPDRDWLKYFRDFADFPEWPDHLYEPLVDGHKLVFIAREEDLEQAWAAVKARVERANELHADWNFGVDDSEPEDPPEEFVRLREAARQRVDALE